MSSQVSKPLHSGSSKSADYQLEAEHVPAGTVYCITLYSAAIWILLPEPHMWKGRVNVDIKLNT